VRCGVGHAGVYALHCGILHCDVLNSPHFTSLYCGALHFIAV
jgi:hypothetical protein